MAKQGKKQKEPKGAVEVIDEGKGKDLMALDKMDDNQLVEIINREAPQIFVEAQKRLILNETPRYVIKKRKGKGGMYWDYVDVGYIIEQLNLLFCYNWDFEHITKTTSVEYLEFSLKIKQFIVDGRLIAKGKNGQQITKDETGRADIKYLKEADKDGNKIALDLGNDIKAAWSDCLKRCASRIGIALDVFSGQVTRRQDSQNLENEITEEQRRRLEVLSSNAGLGHIGLRQLIAEMFDYTSTKDIKRKHFTEISKRLQELEGIKELEDIEIPKDIKEGFDILGIPLAKQLAKFKAYSERGEEGIAELKSKVNAEVDRRQDLEDKKKEKKK